MKRIFTLLAAFVLTISVFAATRPKTMLTVQSLDRSDIRVIIDGRRFEANDNKMRIRGIQAGYHNIKIYKEKQAGGFTIFGKKYEMVFSNNVNIRQGSSVMISIDRYGRARMEENRSGRKDNVYDDRDWRNDRDFDYDNGRNYGDYGDRDRDRNDRDSRWDGNRNGGGYGNDRGYGNDGGYTNGKSGYSTAISTYDFDRVLDNIKRERFENNMVKSASQIISSNFFTSMQVRQLLQLFSYENNKLDLAKMAYAKTVDQRNYQIVFDVFNYTNSRDELARYIRSH